MRTFRPSCSAHDNAVSAHIPCLFRWAIFWLMCHFVIRHFTALLYFEFNFKKVGYNKLSRKLVVFALSCFWRNNCDTMLDEDSLPLQVNGQNESWRILTNVNDGWPRALNYAHGNILYVQYVRCTHHVLLCILHVHRMAITPLRKPRSHTGQAVANSFFFCVKRYEQIKKLLHTYVHRSCDQTHDMSNNFASLIAGKANLWLPNFPRAYIHM